MVAYGLLMSSCGNGWTYVTLSGIPLWFALTLTFSYRLVDLRLSVKSWLDLRPSVKLCMDLYRFVNTILIFVQRKSIISAFMILVYNLLTIIYLVHHDLFFEFFLKMDLRHFVKTLPHACRRLNTESEKPAFIKKTWPSLDQFKYCNCCGTSAVSVINYIFA